MTATFGENFFGKSSPAPAGTEMPIRLTGRVLVVDDHRDVCEAIAKSLQVADCTVEFTTDATDALHKIETFAPDVLISDVRMRTLDGFELLEATNRFDPSIGVILLSGFASVPEAVRAIRIGAEHYLAKPVSYGELLSSVRTLLDRRRHRRAPSPDPKLIEKLPQLEFVWDSEPMRDLLSQIARIAPTNVPVMITGETGSGKERIAQIVHSCSERASRPYVIVRCDAVSETVLERQIFGYEPEAQPGELEQVDGGTLVLDRFDALPASIQPRILRVLESKQFERTGGHRTITVDVRFVTTTHRNSAILIQEGTIRKDLFHRLRGAVLEVPPLRVRKNDITLLTEHVLHRLAKEHSRKAPTLNGDAMRLLTRHEWPGNVRELENVLCAAFAVAYRGAITADLIATQIHAQKVPLRDRLEIPGATFAEIERYAILTTYRACGNNVTRTAEMLGISTRAVHYRLREYAGRTGRRRTRSSPVLPEDANKQLIRQRKGAA
jgi:DNA-binding NtrC family response regulator